MEYLLLIQKLQFELACYNFTMTQFQKFFEDIMSSYDDSFIKVKPNGKFGDWKCDGYSRKTKTVYQCYSPEGISISLALKKMDEDFIGAKQYWKEKMKNWIFVWNARGLYPEIIAKIETFSKENSNLTIGEWNRKKIKQYFFYS